MTNSINRRKSLTGIAAIGTTIAAATVQANNPDQRLVVLLAKVLRLEQEYKIANDALDIADSKVFEKRPKLNPSLKAGECSSGYCIPKTQDQLDFELKTMKLTHPKSAHADLEAKAKAKTDGITEWLAACKVVNDSYRVDELDQIADDIFEKRMATELTILNTPAQTLTGLMVKLEIWAKANAIDIESGRIYENGNEDIAPLAVLNDIKRLINQTS